MTQWHFRATLHFWLRPPMLRWYSTVMGNDLMIIWKLCIHPPLTSSSLEPKTVTQPTQSEPPLPYWIHMQWNVIYWREFQHTVSQPGSVSMTSPAQHHRTLWKKSESSQHLSRSLVTESESKLHGAGAAQSPTSLNPRPSQSHCVSNSRYSRWAVFIIMPNHSYLNHIYTEPLQNLFVLMYKMILWSKNTTH